MSNNKMSYPGEEIDNACNIAFGGIPVLRLPIEDIAISKPAVISKPIIESLDAAEGMDLTKFIDDTSMLFALCEDNKIDPTAITSNNLRLPDQEYDILVKIHQFLFQNGTLDNLQNSTEVGVKYYIPVILALLGREGELEHLFIKFEDAIRDANIRDIIKYGTLIYPTLGVLSDAFIFHHIFSLKYIPRVFHKHLQVNDKFLKILLKKLERAYKDRYWKVASCGLRVNEKWSYGYNFKHPIHPDSSAITIDLELFPYSCIPPQCYRENEKPVLTDYDAHLYISDILWHIQYERNFSLDSLMRHYQDKTHEFYKVIENILLFCNADRRRYLVENFDNPFTQHPLILISLGMDHSDCKYMSFYNNNLRVGNEDTEPLWEEFIMSNRFLKSFRKFIIARGLQPFEILKLMQLWLRADSERGWVAINKYSFVPIVRDFITYWGDGKCEAPRKGWLCALFGGQSDDNFPINSSAITDFPARYEDIDINVNLFNSIVHLKRMFISAIDADDVKLFKAISVKISKQRILAGLFIHQTRIIKYIFENKLTRIYAGVSWEQFRKLNIADKVLLLPQWITMVEPQVFKPKYMFGAAIGIWLEWYGWTAKLDRYSASYNMIEILPCKRECTSACMALAWMSYCPRISIKSFSGIDYTYKGDLFSNPPSEHKYVKISKDTHYFTLYMKRCIANYRASQIPQWIGALTQNNPNRIQLIITSESESEIDEYQ